MGHLNRDISVQIDVIFLHSRQVVQLCALCVGKVSRTAFPSLMMQLEVLREVASASVQVVHLIPMTGETLTLLSMYPLNYC